MFQQLRPYKQFPEVKAKLIAELPTLAAELTAAELTEYVLDAAALANLRAGGQEARTVSLTSKARQLGR